MASFADRVKAAMAARSTPYQTQEFKKGKVVQPKGKKKAKAAKPKPKARKSGAVTISYKDYFGGMQVANAYYSYGQVTYNQLAAQYSPTTTNTGSTMATDNTKQKTYEVGDLVSSLYEGQANNGRTRIKKGDEAEVVGMSGNSYSLKFLTGENKGNNQMYSPDFMKRLPPKRAKIDFDTVIIAAEKRQQILEALEQINQHELIFTKWGFGDLMEKGKGVSMLFYGPPGTGKTLMAQAIADKLDYKLKVIAAADIESSEPGGSERNIRTHFEEANNGKTILLFDECDSLLYSRAGVGAILGAQINELLSQIERFNGITVFTTNRLGTLDEAMNRRLALKLGFAMPSREERVEIWKRMVPAKAPIAKTTIDWHRLAGVEISGGYIKNAVLRAARMAAIEKVINSKKKITMEHFVRALKLETESMIEFEQARDEHKQGIGHAGYDMDGQRVIKRTVKEGVERG